MKKSTKKQIILTIALAACLAVMCLIPAFNVGYQKEIEQQPHEQLPQLFPDSFYILTNHTISNTLHDGIFIHRGSNITIRGNHISNVGSVGTERYHLTVVVYADSLPDLLKCLEVAYP